MSGGWWRGKLRKLQLLPKSCSFITHNLFSLKLAHLRLKLLYLRAQSVSRILPFFYFFRMCRLEFFQFLRMTRFRANQRLCAFFMRFGDADSEVFTLDLESGNRLRVFRGHCRAWLLIARLFLFFQCLNVFAKCKKMRANFRERFFADQHLFDLVNDGEKGHEGRGLEAAKRNSRGNQKKIHFVS